MTLLAMNLPRRICLIVQEECIFTGHSRLADWMKEFKSSLVQERGIGVLKMRSQPPAASMKKLRLVSIRKTSESVSLAVLMISAITRVT